MCKMTFLRAKCLAKVVHTIMVTVVINILTPVRMTVYPPITEFVDGGHLDRENVTLESQVIGKSCSYNGDSCSEC